MYRVGDRVRVKGWCGTVMEVQKNLIVPSHRQQKTRGRRRKSRKPYLVEFDLLSKREWYGANMLEPITTRYQSASEKYDREELKAESITKERRRIRPRFRGDKYVTQ